MCNKPPTCNDGSSAKIQVNNKDEFMNILSNENNGNNWMDFNNNKLMFINILIFGMVFACSVYQVYYCCLSDKNPKYKKMVVDVGDQSN